MYRGLSFDEVQKKVMQSEPLPDGSSMPELLLYKLLEILHREYRAGKIMLSDAKETAAEYRRIFNADMIAEACNRQAIERCNKYSPLLVEAEKHGCEICKKIVRIFDGREKQ